MNSTSVPTPTDRPANGGPINNVRIEPQADGGVIIRREYPEQERKTGLKIIAGLFAVGLLILAVTAVLVRRDLSGVFWMGVVTMFVVAIVHRMARQYTVLTRSYVIRADAAGLSIETTTWRGHTSQQFHRHEIEDVLLDFDRGYGKHRRVFQTILVIQTSVSRKVQCLQNVTGDRLAKVADAIRAALGMPKRPWP